MRIIAKIKTDFPTKFGVPRQSGLVSDLAATIVFEPEFRNPDALRGLDGFSHIWLIWKFSEIEGEAFNPTVRPPKLGGNTKMGVFATRSPFRPNPIGLSSVKIDYIEMSEKFGPLIHVLGADLIDNTPIYDIKPYLPYSDCHPEATDGFVSRADAEPLTVDFPNMLKMLVPKDKQSALTTVLSLDPRPSYHEDSDRLYGFVFAGLEIKFRVNGDTLYVCDVQPAWDKNK